MNKYKAFYKSKDIEVEAESSHQAQVKGAAVFKAKKEYQVTVVLLSVGDREIVHKPLF